MSKNVTIYVQQTGEWFWSFVQRSAGELPSTPLFKILNWVLEQLNFGYWEADRDERGDVVSLTLGKRASMEASSMEEVRQATELRLEAISVTGIFAQARECGIPPHLSDVSKRVSQQTTPWALRNTEFHYAFELIKVLARLNKKTFKLEAPPISGLAPESVVSYLRESTRCWLYGFYGASVALNRACLENTLKQRLPLDPKLWKSLEDLIVDAGRAGLLDGCMVELAETIRKTANKFLHGDSITETDSRIVLDATRSIVEHTFSS